MQTANAPPPALCGQTFHSQTLLPRDWYWPEANCPSHLQRVQSHASSRSSQPCKQPTITYLTSSTTGNQSQRMSQSKRLFFTVASPAGQHDPCQLVPQVPSQFNSNSLTHETFLVFILFFNSFLLL